MPKLPLSDASPLGERLLMMEKAKEEYLEIVGNIRLRQAEKAFVPGAPPTTLEYGDKVLLYGDTTSRWEPSLFVSRNKDKILVMEANGEI